MTSATRSPAAVPTAAGTRTRPTRITRADLLADAGALLAYLALALVVFGPLWANLDGGYLTGSGQDQNMWEWFFAVTAHNVASGHNPLFSTLQNHPAGVNLMANTAMLGLSVPLTPLTLLAGPTVTWAVVLTTGLVGTAAAWYWLLSRHVVTSRLGAAIGGGFAGFAPPIISHANAHPNFVVLFVFPFLVLAVLKLTRGFRPVVWGVLLGLLVSYQAFLGEEALLIGATTFVVFACCYWASDALAHAPGSRCRFPGPGKSAATSRLGGSLRPLVVGGGVALGVFAVLLAFPLWWQFFGPQSYTTLEHGPSGNDLAAFTTFATESLAGQPDAAAELALNRTEENAFFGWPLVVLFAVLAVWLWRDVLARAAAVAAVLMAWISAGAILIVDGTVTGIPGPWLVLAEEPLYESVLESRFALGCVPLVGLVLALATDRVFRVLPGRAERHWRTAARGTFFGTLVVALLPIAPTPLPVHERDPVPAFFAGGTWRSYVDPGGSVVVAPLPDPGSADPLHWQVRAGMGFPLAEGYFVGPHGPDGSGGYGADRRETSSLLEDVAGDGEVPAVDPADRAQARQDLRYWRADVVVLNPHVRHGQALRTTVTRLLGSEPRRVAGVWLWDVRGLTASS